MPDRVVAERGPGPEKEGRKKHEEEPGPPMDNGRERGSRIPVPARGKDQNRSSVEDLRSPQEDVRRFRREKEMAGILLAGGEYPQPVQLFPERTSEVDGERDPGARAVHRYGEGG